MFSYWHFNFLSLSPDHTIALISQASKVMLKILQARLQQYVNHELPDVQAGFRKGRGTRDQIANIHWIISRDITLPTKVRLIKAMVFPVVMYGCELDCEGWALKNWCFWTVVLEKTLESPLDCKEIQPVHSED